LSITERSDYALARLTLLIAKGLNELEERSALDGLCSEKHTGESEVRLAKKQPLMHELGTTFCLSKNNKVDFERLKIFGHRKNGKKKDCECNFEKLGLKASPTAH
jgi:hypothetical protein